MNNNVFALKSNKIVTVCEKGTIEDGVIIINNDKIENIGTYEDLKDKIQNIPIYDYEDKIITPSLIDCHCHLLEYAGGSVYPVTEYSYLYGGKSLLFKALLNGITTIGEQVCGSPICNIDLDKYLNISKDSPIRIKFSLNTITIGTEPLANYTCLHGNKTVEKSILYDFETISSISKRSEFPGENLFINASPANLPSSLVPNAGKIILSEGEIKSIVNIYHENGKKIGCHVAGEEGIDIALSCGFDVLHHAHGITDSQILKVKNNNVSIVTTPLGGTHLNPNSPSDVLKLVKEGINVSIATDAYLPAASNLGLDENQLYGSDILMFISRPIMKLLFENGFDENICLSLLTYNPAKILGLDNEVGKLDIGMDADLLIANGVPGLEITDCEDICEVFIKGKKVICR